MTKLPSTRILITIAMLILFFVFLVAVLFVTNLSFSVWEQLQQKPDWLISAYLLAIILISILFGRIIWRLLISGNRKSVNKQRSRVVVDNMDAVTQRLETLSHNLSDEDIPVITQGNSSRQSKPIVSDKSDSIEQSAQESNDSVKRPGELDENAVIDEKWASEFETSSEVAEIRAELQEFGRRKAQQTLYIALFGDISSGKSSLIKALINHDNGNCDLQETAKEQTIETAVIGGTTREVKHYQWSIENDDVDQQYILTDLPGLNEQFAELDALAADEVQRAHIAVFLCDGDLTDTQFQELKTLISLKKPCLVAVNKSDRYSKEDLQLIISKIKHRIETVMEENMTANVPVLTITAGGMREFIRMTPDGQEQRVQRSIQPDILKLQEQLQSMMQQYGTDQLEQLREKSVAHMLNNKLDEIDARFKHSKSLRMVNGYTKKAIVAALATISPGTDILVQGYLGIQMIKDLCKLYDVPATDIDANKLIELIQTRMDKTLPLLLAIAGNGFKAFPGVGTVTGGLMHAVAYGMIFDTLGRSVARTLEMTGELSPKLISDLYKEQLSENIDSRTKDFIKLVLKLRKSD